MGTQAILNTRFVYLSYSFTSMSLYFQSEVVSMYNMHTPQEHNAGSVPKYLWLLIKDTALVGKLN